MIVDPNSVPWHPGPPSLPVSRSVGLLGGSFNPAHAGHRHIAELALALLDLDEVWWMVSPQNPLKSGDDMAPFEERFASAVARADHPGMRVTGIEQIMGSTYTAETLNKLIAVFPNTNFVWMMGADNLIQIPKWKDWPQIFHTLPVAVFARPSYSARALSGAAATRFRRARVRQQDSRMLPLLAPPAWVFLNTRLHPGSATEIRRRRSETLV